MTGIESGGTGNGFGDDGIPGSVRGEAGIGEIFRGGAGGVGWGANTKVLFRLMEEGALPSPA